VVIPPWNGQFGKHLRALKEAAQAQLADQPQTDRPADEAVN